MCLVDVVINIMDSNFSLVNFTAVVYLDGKTEICESKLFILTCIKLYYDTMFLLMIPCFYYYLPCHVIYFIFIYFSTKMAYVSYYRFI